MEKGRSKKSWDEVLKEDMKKRGLNINDAQDRKKWRMLQKSGRPRLTEKKTLLLRQNGEEL